MNRCAPCALLLVVLLTGVLAGCGSSTPASTSSASDAKTASLRVDPTGASLSSVQNAIGQLYRDHPAVAHYSTQDVSYTTESRTRVLEACSRPGQASSANVETGRVLACAPLVFFFFSYGRQTAVKEATQVANTIYTYASTAIQGPLNARVMLDGILRGWGLPISGSGTASSTPSASPVAAATVASTRKAILSQGGVQITITGEEGSGQRAAEGISADVGSRTGMEMVHEGTATASIRVTPAAAYISGNAAGLTRLLGLPAVQARRAARWLRIPAGSNEYKDLATENTIAALPASILPTAADAVTVANAREGGRPVWLLRWTSVGANGGEIRATLTVTASEALPLSEVTASGTHRQTADFSGWGRAPRVIAPRSQVPLGISGR